VFPFKKEDPAVIQTEAPHVPFLFPGDETPSRNPYANIPLNVSALEKDEEGKFASVGHELKYAQLENGLRIASCDRGGVHSSLGLFVDAGTRLEDPSNFGVSHMMELMAFQSSKHLSHLRTVKTVEAVAAHASAMSGKEHLVYSVDCLRQFMPLMVPLMVGNVASPLFLPEEVEKAASKVEDVWRKAAMNPEHQVTELLHAAAYQNNTLGFPTHCSEQSLEYFNEETMRKFMADYFTPDRMVFVGVNVNHDELCKWLMRSFAEYKTPPPNPHVQRPRATYTGGDCRMEAPIEMMHLAVGWETAGWNSEDLVPATVLQTILGGGGSFSMGGPGKGMHSRLYTQVLNHQSGVESCIAFNSMYADSGLFGLYFQGHAECGADVTNQLVSQARKLGTVTGDELRRAKNALKASIHMNLETKAVLVEDVGRQLLMSGTWQSPGELTEKIDAVNEPEIAALVHRIFKKPPSVAAYGHIGGERGVPGYEEIRTKLTARR